MQEKQVSLTAVHILLFRFSDCLLKRKCGDKYLVCSCSGTGGTVFSVYAG